MAASSGSSLPSERNQAKGGRGLHGLIGGFFSWERGEQRVSKTGKPGPKIVPRTRRGFKIRWRWIAFMMSYSAPVPRPFAKVAFQRLRTGSNKAQSRKGVKVCLGLSALFQAARYVHEEKCCVILATSRTRAMNVLCHRQARTSTSRLPLRRARRGFLASNRISPL